MVLNNLSCFYCYFCNCAVHVNGKFINKNLINYIKIFLMFCQADVCIIPFLNLTCVVYKTFFIVLTFVLFSVLDYFIILTFILYYAGF